MIKNAKSTKNDINVERWKKITKSIYIFLLNIHKKMLENE